MVEDDVITFHFGAAVSSSLSLLNFDGNVVIGFVLNPSCVFKPGALNFRRGSRRSFDLDNRLPIAPKLDGTLERTC